MKKTVINTSTHPLTLSSGRVLAPGERADGVEVGGSYEQALLDDRSLRALEPKPKATRKSATPPVPQDTGLSDEENN